MYFILHTVYCTLYTVHYIITYCMLHYTVLHCTALHCTVPYCAVLHCTALHCTVLYCTVLCCNVLYCAVMYCAVLYCTVLYCPVLYVLHFSASVRVPPCCRSRGASAAMARLSWLHLPSGAAARSAPTSLQSMLSMSASGVADVGRCRSVLGAPQEWPACRVWRWEGLCSRLADPMARPAGWAQSRN